jgi:hypothetical protein
LQAELQTQQKAEPVDAIERRPPGVVLQLGHGLRAYAELAGDVCLGPAKLHAGRAQLGAELVWKSDDVHEINLQVESDEINLQVDYAKINL